MGWVKEQCNQALAQRLEEEAKQFGKIKPRFWHRLLSGTNAIFGVRAVLHEQSKVLYLEIPKVACTSMKRSFLESEEIRRKLDEEKHAYIDRSRLHGAWHYFHSNDIWQSVFRIKEHPRTLQQDLLKIKGLRSHRNDWLYGKWKFKLAGYDKERGFNQKHITAQQLNEYFVFTFVRNPFARFVSNFQNKYVRLAKSEMDMTAKDRPSFIFRDAFIYVRSVRNFNDLVHRISQIPYRYMDRHIVPQSLFLEKLAQLGGQINLIGRLENIAEEFEPIRKKYGLLPLELTHKSALRGKRKTWQDYYTAETAKLIYDTYRKDFELFGYQDEYPKLLDYIAQRQEKEAEQIRGSSHVQAVS